MALPIGGKIRQQRSRELGSVQPELAGQGAGMEWLDGARAGGSCWSS